MAMLTVEGDFENGRTTKRIKHGQLISVDDDIGVVALLDD